MNENMELPPAPQVGTTAPPSGAQSWPMPVVLTGLAGLAVCIGSLLPWATVTTAFGTLSVAGTSGDGKITLGLGVTLLVLAALQLSKNPLRPWVLTLLVGAAAGAIAIYDLVNVSNKAGELSSAFARADVGIGLWVVVAGGVLAVVAALTGRRS